MAEFAMTCQRCDTPFVARTRLGKWCSKICADRAYRQRHSTRIGKRRRSTVQRVRANAAKRKAHGETAPGRPKDSLPARGPEANGRERESAERAAKTTGTSGAQPAKRAWRNTSDILPTLRPAPPSPRTGDTRRARAIARLQLGGDVEEIAEDLGLDVEDVAQLALDVLEHGWSA